jgi:hypothetical protein
VRKPVIQNLVGEPRALIQKARGIRGDTPTSTPNDKMTPEAPQTILSRIRFISSNENARRVSDLTLPREPTLKASADPDLSFGLLVVFTAAQVWGDLERAGSAVATEAEERETPEFDV